ncbi:MAG: hypothetical protein LC754_07815 [Acidobacteria bacterium]|nr:hypothetical protein [Acidobacteriota bacterium]
MNKCPYCVRPLRMGGIQCRACRRYVLRWPHVVLLIVLGVATLAALLELLLKLEVGR